MLSSQTGMRSCRFVKCHPCAHWVTHLLCVDFRASETLLDRSMASSIKTELAIEWKVDVVTKIFDACSSMHAWDRFWSEMPTCPQWPAWQLWTR